ncbi:hypothetical protein CLV72_10587 [Allonocardiopsis opalescens]|uniref:Uncharacterized protein n=1 Tax=Allonocardiopsis opalescens TaxID=1144618 RepID=A0A2T0Q1R3_9ACTN|nr:hypothetical protein CLV72_10587 [Allonocardiopsis opalescens]
MSEIPGLLGNLLPGDEIVDLEGWRLELSEGDQD